MTKADKEGQRKAPILRFKGFTDDWEQRQLREISSGTIGGGTPKSSNKKFWNGNIPWIQSSDLVNGDIWNITIKKHITLDAVENSAAKIISANSIAVVTRVAVGKLVYMPLEYATSQDFISFQNLSGDHSFFMYLVSKVMHKVKGSLQGTSIKGISKGELLKKKVIYTLNIKEQKKIGTLLKSLDTILTLYERKVRLYKLIFKKAINSIVNVSSSSEISLGNIFDVITDYVANGSFKSLRENVKHYSSEEYAYLIRLQDFNNHWKGPWLYTDKKGFDFLKKSKLQTGDIILSNVGSVGKIFQVPSLDKPMTLAPNSILLKTEKNNEDYMYYLMLSSNFQRKLKEKVTPGVQEKINKTDLKKIKIKLPSKNQQDSIAELLKTINSYIKHLQQKASYLKDIKKELLNTMFI